MKTKNIYIKSFDFENEYFIINDKYEKKYFIKIKDGTIICDVMTEEEIEVGVKYLEIGDIIKIYGNKINFNKFIIKKIFIKTKYRFDSDSSDDYNFYN